MYLVDKFVVTNPVRYTHVCLFVVTADKFVVTAHSIRVCYKWALLDIIQQFLDSPWGDSHCPLIGPQQSLTVLPLVVRAPPPADH